MNFKSRKEYEKSINEKVQVKEDLKEQGEKLKSDKSFIEELKCMVKDSPDDESSRRTLRKIEAAEDEADESRGEITREYQGNKKEMSEERDELVELLEKIRKDKQKVEEANRKISNDSLKIDESSLEEDEDEIDELKEKADEKDDDDLII